MTVSDFLTGGVVIALIVSGIAFFIFGHAALEHFRPGTRKRALVFGVIAALAVPVTYCLFRLFVERTYGSF